MEVSGSLLKFRGQLDPETFLEGFGGGFGVTWEVSGSLWEVSGSTWKVSGSLGRFRGQLDPETSLGGFGVNTTCYETHEILVLGGFEIF